MRKLEHLNFRNFTFVVVLEASTCLTYISKTTHHKKSKRSDPPRRLENEVVQGNRHPHSASEDQIIFAF